VNPTSGFNYNDIVNEFFGGSNFKGRSIQFRVEISLKEVLTGCTKPITIKRRKKCLTCAGTGITGFSSCKNCQGSGFFKTQDSPFELQQACMVCGGTGKSDIVKCKDCLGQGFMVATEEKTINVKIPPGIENGMQIRIVGEGEPSLRHGGKAGDVIVFVLVKDFAPFSREGANLTLEVPVSYGQLCLGDSVEIPTLNEGVYLIKIPPGSQPNTKFRIKGKGLPIGGSFGDLIATVKVEVPKNLDEEYRKVLESLIKMEKEFITPRRKAWSEAKYEQVH
jgi:molecular chaperone DnaJ